MNPLLEQFLAEARDLLENTGTKLMQLEDAPSDDGIINELFRCVHTLKGNSGLFTFPEMTRVLHGAEDLLGMVRSGHATYSRELADRLLEAMDFVGILCGEIETTEHIDASRAADSQQMAEALRMLMPRLNTSEIGAETAHSNSTVPMPANASTSPVDAPRFGLPQLAGIPEAIRIAIFQQSHPEDLLHWIAYRPQRGCFFNGDDPLNSARQTPGLVWGCVIAQEPLPSLDELDTYSCLLGFDQLSTAPREEIEEYYRYLPDQVEITALRPQWLVKGQGDTDRTREVSAVPSPIRQFSEDDRAAFEQILAAQRQILLLDDRPAWHAGRLKAVAEVLASLLCVSGRAARTSRSPTSQRRILRCDRDAR
jgi:two-component system chemotaxis sensor kinase CheA